MPLRTQVDEMPNVNMTSMIDVVFLLIIFFMVGTRFADLEREINLNVPQVADKGVLKAAAERRVINVYQNGEVTLDGRSVTLDELTTQLTADHQHTLDRGVLVRGDGAGNFQRIAEVLNACKQAGVAELSLSAKVEQRRR